MNMASISRQGMTSPTLRTLTRSSICRQSYVERRQFSATPQSRFSVVEAVTLLPSTVMTGLHGAGLPWYAVIPATAFIFRGILSYRLSEANQEKARRRAALQPLLGGMMAGSTLQHIISAQQKGRVLPLQGALYRTVTLIRASRFLNKRWDSRAIDHRTFAHLAILYSCAEAVRIKAGAGTGLLGMLTEVVTSRLPARSVSAYAPPSTPQTPSTTVETPMTLSAANTVSSPTETTSQMFPGSSLSVQDVSDAVVSTPLSAADPSMKLEGLSWCTDLTVADPTGTLPDLVMAAMVLNIILRPSRSNARDFAGWLRTFNGFDFLLFGLSFYLRLCGDYIPAAVLLYFLSSLVVGRTLQIWLLMRKPVPRAILPCKIKPQWRIARSERSNE